MTLITAARIKALALRAVGAENLAAALEANRGHFGVVSPLTVAHFMAQCCHESGGFARFTENLNYKDPKRLDSMFSAVRGEADAAALIKLGPVAIANRVYANRLGNGSEGSGDGAKFLGRGLIQLTGRDSYTKAGADLGRPYAEKPQTVAEPEGAVLTALWFWKINRCSIPASQDDVPGVTLIINGPKMAGLEEREHLTAKAKDIFK